MEEGLLEIIYQDRDIVVLHKPEGLLSVPGKGEDKQDCVSARLRRLFPGAPENPAVHRLDMDTSGVMVYALSREAHRNLSIQFQDRRVTKRYVALLAGTVTGSSGEIRLSTRVDPENRPYQIVDPEHGRMGITLWENLGREGSCTRILFTPLTGRTHQLRIHSAFPGGLGFPILGDRLYGTRAPGQRLCLHARDLEFSHPRDGRPMVFRVPVPF